MPVCANCGSQQPDGAEFCGECGAALEGGAPATSPDTHPPTALAATCSACGVSVTPGSDSCPNCGATLDEAVPASPPETMLVCSNCGARLEPDSNFCDMCGMAVRVAPGAPAPPPSAVDPAVLVSGADPLATPVPPPARPPTPAVLGRLVVQDTHAALPLPYGKTEIVIGRKDAVVGIFPDIDLTDHGGEQGGVSRRHACITIQGTQVFIEDLDSTNYTQVNRQKLEPGQPHLLNDGDEIQLGRVKLLFYR